ncbi:hypothetical protein PHJA_001437400 [Phtheirospermum japonicum]|uniref:Uncharacterized protein n=1 Tax=Phtheirospermum japonicum TaxID=374723 RepID=A0A830CF27_9LAMI|nr:hypothetical protein PHJA_001437400 [Phtheirospermum japonicum]
MAVSDRHGRASSDNSPPPDEIGGKDDEEIDEFMAESRLIYHDKESEQPENRIVPFEPAHKHDPKGIQWSIFYTASKRAANSLRFWIAALLLVPMMRTMANQFHEAFGTVDVIDERPHVTFSRPFCRVKDGKNHSIMLDQVGALHTPSGGMLAR